MAEAEWTGFEISNKQLERWTIPLSFVKDGSFVLLPQKRERERDKIKETRSRVTGGAIPLAAFVIARCIGARLCLRLAVPPCVPIRGMLRSYHARGTKRRSTLAWLRNPPKDETRAYQWGMMRSFVLCTGPALSC